MSSDHGNDKRPIIRVVKKKIIAGGHHGGAWKVAYADFVTAMMAFFLVMWLISMDQATKEKIQDYFSNPFSSSQNKAGIAKMAMGGKSPIAIGAGVGLNARNWRDLAMTLQRDRFTRTQQKVQSQMASQPELAKLAKQVEIKLTTYGMLIELIEAQNSPFFASGSAQVPPATNKLLRVIAQEVGKLPNLVWIEGHTDAVPYSKGSDYSNWELSADRANAARRVMEGAGLFDKQVIQVRGYADSRLRDPEKPTDASNRRVSIVILFQVEPEEKKQESPAPKGEPKAEVHQVTADDIKKTPLELTLERQHELDMRVSTDSWAQDPLGLELQKRGPLGKIN